MNTNNVITFEGSDRDHGGLLTGMLKTGAQKLIEQAVAMAFAELLKSLQGCCLAAGKPRYHTQRLSAGPGVVNQSGPVTVRAYW